MSKCECKNCIHYELCIWQNGGVNLMSLNDCDHYKDKSLFVELPMFLGQTLYKSYDWGKKKEVCECRVSSLTQKADGSWKIRLTNLSSRCVFEITLDQIGKTVFLDREQAEAKLKEIEGK